MKSIINIEDLIQNVSYMNDDEISMVRKAYEIANEMHSGQVRQSGEPYIVHPLSVANILTEMKADCDTICAALLHDTIEDTALTKEEIIEQFNKTVATLVDGVTKISNTCFSSKHEQNLANTRKIITSLTTDVRIIIIKLADRLHNMRTLGFKSEYKQKENAIETMEIFVPLAYYIGAYRIKSELEDISLRYINPKAYHDIEEKKEKIELESSLCLTEMFQMIDYTLTKKNIPNDIKLRTKNIYGIYKRLYEGHKIKDIHDLLAIKVMVKDIDECYRTLGIIHGLYHPINGKIKDYICNPKTNMYQSLHTTVFGPEERLVQTQIRTFDMDQIASFGLATYWNMCGNDEARLKMQQDLKDKYQFYKSLTELDSTFTDNQEFVNRVKSEILASNIYVIVNGNTIELPKGSNPIDLAYRINTNVGNTMTGVIVNDEQVSCDYTLKTNDIVRIITDDMSFGPRKEWEDKAHTSYAKQKIKEFFIK